MADVPGALNLERLEPLPRLPVQYRARQPRVSSRHTGFIADPEFSQCSAQSTTNREARWLAVVARRVTSRLRLLYGNRWVWTENEEGERRGTRGARCGSFSTAFFCLGAVLYRGDVDTLEEPRPHQTRHPKEITGSRDQRGGSSATAQRDATVEDLAKCCEVPEQRAPLVMGAGAACFSPGSHGSALSTLAAISPVLSWGDKPRRKRPVRPYSRLSTGRRAPAGPWTRCPGPGLYRLSVRRISQSHRTRRPSRTTAAGPPQAAHPQQDQQRGRRPLAGRF